MTVKDLEIIARDMGATIHWEGCSIGVKSPDGFIWGSNLYQFIFFQSRGNIVINGTHYVKAIFGCGLARPERRPTR